MKANKLLTGALAILMVVGMSLSTFAATPNPLSDQCAEDGHNHDNETFVSQEITLESPANQTQAAAAACSMHLSEWRTTSTTQVTPTAADKNNGACPKTKTTVRTEKLYCASCNAYLNQTRTTRTITPHYFVYQYQQGYLCNYGCGTAKL